jgi:ABC-2 type transport system permease protein
MAASRGRSLVPWAIRSHRSGALGLGLGLGLLVVITGPSYVAAAKAIAGGLQTLAAQGEPVARQFAFLTGPVERLDTVGGYLSYKVFGSVALLVALYAAVQGAQVIRGSEAKGLVELWLSTGRTRSQLLGARTLSFALVLAAIVAAIYAGTGLSGVLSGEQLWGAALGQCLAIGLVGGCAFAMAAVVAQFVRSARTAAAVASVYMVTAYFIANLADSLGGFAFARFLSPFFYYQQARTLVPGVALDGTAMAVLLGATLILALAAWRLQLLRDVGGVVLAWERRARTPAYVFHPSRVVRRWLWLSWIWEQRLGVISWSAGIFALTAIETAVIPTALRLIRSDSGTLAKLARSAALTEDQYVAFVIAFAVIVVAGFAVYEVGHWAGDASQHRTDAILAQPVSIRRFVAERTASLVVMTAMLAGALVLGAMAGAALGGYTLDSSGLLRSVVVTALFGVAVGGVGLLAVAALRSSAATAGVGALLVACFFLTTISGLLHWPAWSNWPSVFNAVGSPYRAWPPPGDLAYLGALALVGAVAAYAVMKRGRRIDA